MNDGVIWWRLFSKVSVVRVGLEGITVSTYILSVGCYTFLFKLKAQYHQVEPVSTSAAVRIGCVSGMFKGHICLMATLLVF